MADPAQLYEEDLVRWAETQAAARRDAAGSGADLPLDWENLAEEVEDLGSSQCIERRGRLATIIEHLMRLEVSPVRDPRRSWAETVPRARLHLQRLLKDSPSLQQIAGMIAEETMQAAKLVAFNFAAHDEATPAMLARVRAISCSEAQVLGGWFPGETSP